MPHTDLASAFNGQYFVVTGSTQGLGAAVAHTLAQRGAAGLIVCCLLYTSPSPRD